MTKKEQREKKIKDILKKVLNVFCYVVTALAIILGIAVGVTKCSGSAATETGAAERTELSKPSNSLVVRDNSISLDDYFVYVSKYWGSISVDFDNLRQAQNISTSTSAINRGNITYNWYCGSECYWLQGNQYYQLRYVQFFWSDRAMSSSVSNIFEYKLWNVYLVSYDSNAVWTNIYHRENSYATGDDTGTFQHVRIILTSDVVSDVGFLALFKKGEKSEFEFNKAFNYNAPLRVDVDAVYGTTSSWTGLNFIRYNTGWFYSNGRFFDSIEWHAFDLTYSATLEINGSVKTLTIENAYSYLNLYYCNSQTGEDIMVNSRDTRPNSDGVTQYFASSATWFIPAYRKIVFLSELTSSVKDSLEAFNNNNQSSYSGGLISGEVNDVFTLVAGAFTAWLPVLGMYILPNITIGTLLFVPLVALLVFAIIRIIKK